LLLANFTSTISHFFLFSIAIPNGDSKEILNSSNTLTSPGHTIDTVNGLSPSISSVT
jgi:hypothetical protein